MLSYEAVIHVLIDYSEVHQLLEANAHLIGEDLRGELKELTGNMVYDYFSRYSAVTERPLGSGHPPTIRAQTADMDEWENSMAAAAAANLIVKITQEYLPNFQSHRTEDCAGILNITMRGTVAHLEINPHAYKSFISKPL